ncbi:MAG: hypothetical protein MZW92_69045 [Comamonadaceae bacterium]|nr:hypothetical protein [Comamonadaceae bacterium]
MHAVLDEQRRQPVRRPRALAALAAHHGRARSPAGGRAPPDGERRPPRRARPRTDSSCTGRRLLPVLMAATSRCSAASPRSAARAYLEAARAARATPRIARRATEIALGAAPARTRSKRPRALARTRSRVAERRGRRSPRWLGQRRGCGDRRRRAPSAAREVPGRRRAHRARRAASVPASSTACSAHQPDKARCSALIERARAALCRQLPEAQLRGRARRPAARASPTRRRRRSRWRRPTARSRSRPDWEPRGAAQGRSSSARQSAGAGDRLSQATLVERQPRIGDRGPDALRAAAASSRSATRKRARCSRRLLGAGSAAAATLQFARRACCRCRRRTGRPRKRRSQDLKRAGFGERGPVEYYLAPGRRGARQHRPRRSRATARCRDGERVMARAAAHARTVMGKQGKRSTRRGDYLADLPAVTIEQRVQVRARRGAAAARRATTTRRRCAVLDQRRSRELPDRPDAALRHARWSPEKLDRIDDAESGAAPPDRAEARRRARATTRWATRSSIATSAHRRRRFELIEQAH